MTSPVSQAGAKLAVPDEPRLSRLVEEQFSFVWRLLRRVGVSEADADEAAQRVFGAVSRRLGDIRAGSERAFLLSTALHVAARVRRETAGAGENHASEAELEAADAAPSQPEEGLDQRACALVDELLAEMPLELRVVFALHELEQLERAEISEIVGVPLTTVETRLRGAREDFTNRVARLEGTASSAQGSTGGEPTGPLLESGSELVRVLLIAARDEEPDPTAITRALEATAPDAISTRIASVPPSAKPQPLTRGIRSSEPAAPNSSTNGAPVPTGALIAKWLLIGVLIGTALSVAIFGLSGAFDRAAPSQAPALH